MPSLYISKDHQRNPGSTFAGGSKMPNLAAYADVSRGVNIRAPKLGTYAIAPNIDRVGPAVTGEALEAVSGQLAQSAEYLSNIKIALEAEKGRKLAFASTQQVLYEGDDALFKKKGQAFVDASRGVLQQIQQSNKAIAEGLDPAARFVFMEQATQQYEQIQGQVNRQELNELQVANQAASDRRLSDMVLQLGQAKPKDYPGIIATQTAAALAESNIVDPEEQVVYSREIQEKAFVAGVRGLASSGKSPAERNLALDNAEELLGQMRKAPGTNLVLVDNLAQEIYDKRESVNRMLYRAEDDADRHALKLQKEMYVSYLNDFHEAVLASQDDPAAADRIVYEMEHDPSLDETTRMDIRRSVKTILTDDPSDPDLLANTLMLASESGGPRSDPDAFYESFDQIKNRNDRLIVLNTMRLSRNKNTMQLAKQVQDAMIQAKMSMGSNAIYVNNKTSQAYQTTLSVLTPEILKAQDAILTAATTATANKRLLDVKVLYKNIMTNYVRNLTPEVPEVPEVNSKYEPFGYDAFTTELKAGRYATSAEAFAAYDSLKRRRKPWRDSGEWVAAQQLYNSQASSLILQHFNEQPTAADAGASIGVNINE